MIVAIFFVAFFGYVEIVNLNSYQMTYRQKILKAVYPVFMLINKLTGKKSQVISSPGKTAPARSLYDLSVPLNSGDNLKLETLKGRKILLVNTASDCGYTDQYEDLQRLFEENKDKLVVIGFPSNDFKEQEKGTDEQIAAFCKKNYGVTFPLALKSTVKKVEGQNEIFRWLTDKKQNGWNDQPPVWNFSKYLVNEQGLLTNYFDPAVSPSSEQVKNAIKQ